MPRTSRDQVGQLARQAVAVRLGEDDVVQLGMLGEHRPVEVEQVAVEGRDPGGRQHDPVAPHPESARRTIRASAEDRPGEQVFEPAHPPGQARMRTTMFWPSSVVSASLMSCAMTSATWLGCMILRQVLLGRQLASEVGRGPSRRDAVDLDPAAGQLVGERRRHRHDGRLRRGIGQPAGARGDPRRRRHVQDLGRPVDHVAGHLADEHEHREDVDGVGRDDVVGRRVEERLRIGVARDVEQDVDAAEAVVDAAHEAGDAVEVGQVVRDAARSACRRARAPRPSPRAPPRCGR